MIEENQPLISFYEPYFLINVRDLYDKHGRLAVLVEYSRQGGNSETFVILWWQQWNVMFASIVPKHLARISIWTPSLHQMDTARPKNHIAVVKRGIYYLAIDEPDERDVIKYYMDDFDRNNVQLQAYIPDHDGKLRKGVY